MVSEKRRMDSARLMGNVNADIANGIHVQVKEGVDAFIPSQNSGVNPKLPPACRKLADFKSASDNPAVQARMVLQSPDFLDKGSQNGSEQVMGFPAPLQHYQHGIEHGSGKPSFPKPPKTA